MEDYQKRAGTINLGDEYEHLIPALFALRTVCRSDIVDMWLASNAEGMGAFDDVVFYVEYLNGQKKAYVMQLKHKGSAITATAFTNSGSDDYTIIKYQKSFEEIMQNTKTKKMLENIDSENIRFILYTIGDLALTMDKEVMNKLNLVLYREDMDEKEFSLLNTSANNNCVYTFKMEDESKGGYNKTFLTQFYFYINQSPTILVENFIQQIISENFANSNTNIKLNLLNFIKMWVRGDLGGHYKLRKNEFQLKLTELLLNSYLAVPKSFGKFKNVDLWNSIVKTSEIIVLKNYTEEMVSMLWSAVKSIMYKETDTKLRDDTSWENSIEVKLEDLPKKFKKQNLLYSLTLKQVGSDRELTMKNLYIILWKAGLVPLLVKAGDLTEAKNIFATLSISNDQKFKRHIIVLFKGEDILFCENQSTLHTLADVKDVNLIQKVLENVKISLQGREAIQLSKIITKESGVLKEITAGMLLRMMYEPLRIGKKYEDLPENYIKRNVSKIVLDKGVLKCSGDVFVINGPGDVVDDIKALTDPWRVIDGKNYFKEIITRERGHIVVLQDEIELPLKEKQHLAINKENFHYLRYYNGDLEWVRSVGPLDGIRKYIKNVQACVDEEDILKHFSSNINIISSNPGMGKSVMIKCLARNCMKDFWVETIILSNHHKDFKQQSNPVFIKASGTEGLYKTFAESIIATLKEQKKIYVLMDAFDEISSECFNSVIKLAKFYQKLGYRLWITTRPSHSTFLETKLNTFSISLNPFTVHDQKIYLTKLLFKKKQQNIHNFVDKLQNVMSKSFCNWNEDFLGVPLHLQMIAVVFENKNIANLNILDKISSVDLYEAFIDNKFDVYWKKMFGENINGLNERIYDRLLIQLKNQHEKASLLLFFPINTLVKIIDLMEIEDFLKDPVTGDVGIIISGNNWEQPSFSHRTFAEFLAATFLAKNCKNELIKPLLVALFNEELIVVRQLFDRMLAKGCPLHLAVLNKNLDEVKKFVQKPKLDYDFGGRTPLHLAAAQGSRHRFPKNIINIESHDHKVNFVEAHILKILENLLKIQKYEESFDNILGWSAIDYACNSYSLDVLEIMLQNNHPDTILDFFPKTSLIYYSVKFCYKNILSRLTMDGHITIDGKTNLIHLAVNHPEILDILFKKFTPQRMNGYLQSKDWDGNLPIMKSAIGGDLKVLQIFLKHKVDFNKNNLYGLTIIHILTFYDHLECLEKIIKNKTIDLNSRSAAHRLRDHNFKNPGHTALYFAINKNNLDITKLLIQNGASVNLKYENYRTLLHVASLNGFNDAIQILINSGCEINSVDDNCRTPLHYAAQNIKINSINLLLQLGADINKPDAFGLTPLHYATQNFALNQIEFPQGFKIDSRDKFGRTLLHYAAQKIPIEERTKFVLLLGKDMSFWHHYGTTPAYRASNEVRLSNIDFLIKSGVSPNEGDNNGRTPLHYATEQNILENIELLIKLGANINKANKLAQTPLFEATQSGSLETIKFFLKFSTDLNKSNNFKVAPIHVATEKKFNKCVKVLIENGANINLSTIDGCTPLFIAVRKNNQQLVRLLLENKANINKPSHDTFNKGNSNCVDGNNCQTPTNILSPLQAAIQAGNMKIITLLLESKPKINQTDKNGWTALHFAAYHGCVECIDGLVNQGAELHKQNHDGSTPLHLAVTQNQCKALEKMLRAKRTKAINLLDNTKQSPLHLACYHECVDCVKLLTEKGADLNLRTSEGFTSLDLAINQGHKGIQEYFEQLSVAD